MILEALACGRPVIVREHALPPEFGGLPVFGYRDASDLDEALTALPGASVSAAETARALRNRPVW